MMSMRDSPIRRQPIRRPPWLVGVVIVVAVLVVVAVVYALVNLVGGGSTGQAGAVPDSSASPCVTATVTAGSVLPVPKDVKVNVYNATSKSGLASDTAKELAARGFKIVKIANDPLGKKIDGVAQIRYGPKGEPAAQLLLIYVPGAELVNDYRTGPRIDLSTGKTYSGLSPQQGVKALLASPTPVASGAGCLPVAMAPAPVLPLPTPSAAQG